MGAPRFVLLLLLCTGCTSTTSTILNRLDSDLFVGHSNGKPGIHEQTRPFKGVPITVRVPTHVDVAIQEKVRLFVNGKTLRLVHSSKPHLFVTTKAVYTDKVFTVDPKRPAAGSLDYSMQFGDRTAAGDNSQYFKTITSRIQDETLQDVTAALQTVMSAVTTSGADSGERIDASDGDGKAIGYVTEERTVAWRRFDIDAIDFEDQVQCFVTEHMEKCGQCLINRTPFGTVPEAPEIFAPLEPARMNPGEHAEALTPRLLNSAVQQN